MRTSVLIAIEVILQLLLARIPIMTVAERRVNLHV